MRTPRLRLRGLRCGSAVALLVLAGALFVPSRPADAQLLPLISRLAGPFAGHQHQPNEPLNDQGGLGHGAEARHFPLLLPLQDSMIDFDGPRRASAAAPGDFDQHGAAVRPSAKSDADVPETSKNIWEVVVGSCAGGAFLGSFSAVTAAGAAAALSQRPPPRQRRRWWHRSQHRRSPSRRDRGASWASPPPSSACPPSRAGTY
jgi:hypothetical protein